MAFTVPDYTSYYNAAQTKLNEYYQRILQEEEYDVERAKRRLDEDYKRGTRINLEDYERNIQFGRESYGASVKEQQLESESERRKLEGDMLSRGVSQGGLAEGQQARLKTRQDMRREAIDRALRKSEEDLKYGKERGLEQETLTQRRGTEDVATQFAKFQLEKKQEREDKALGLAEADYQREFSKRSTEEGFRLQQEGLNISREGLNLAKG